MTGREVDADVGERPVLDRVDEDAVQGDETAGELEQVTRRRRPTGEAPPLPARERWRGQRWLLVATVATVGSLVSLAYFESDAVVRVDQAIAQAFVRARTSVTVGLAELLAHLTDEWVLRVLRWGTVAVLLAVRRLRHLLVFVAALLAVEYLVAIMNFAITRPRPMVEIIGVWEGFAHPSRPIAGLAVTLIGAVRVLVPTGVWRVRATWAAGGVLLAVGLARMLLGVDHASDVLVAAAIGGGLGFASLRLLAPTSIVPVVYRRGQTAHVAIDDARVEAVRTALRDQLGVEVVDVNLHGADGSAGSTPMRIDVREGGRTGVLFGKLYTRQHLRSDRAYKLVRTLLYGNLEDESPFTTVRRLVQYEDYLSRVIRDAGIPTPNPRGFVEITPEREYLLVFDFLAGEVLGDCEVDTEVIDDALRLVQKLWAGGIAHRDVKPANVMVADGRVHLIDTAFAQLRPSPWRQAVDLAAMMLVLALRSDVETVYERAKAQFSEEEIAEAFAATSGFAIPGELREKLKEADDDLVERFRELAPDRPPISIHRWGTRRVALAVATFLGALAFGWLAYASLTTAGML